MANINSVCLWKLQPIHCSLRLAYSLNCSWYLHNRKLQSSAVSGRLRRGFVNVQQSLISTGDSAEWQQHKFYSAFSTYMSRNWEMGSILVYLKRTNKLGGKNDLLPFLETRRMGWTFISFQTLLSWPRWSESWLKLWKANGMGCCKMQFLLYIAWSFRLSIGAVGVESHLKWYACLAKKKNPFNDWGTLHNTTISISSVKQFDI